MKIFLSWSGDRSRQVADLLDDWLQCVLQAVNPWMSSKNIDRGALWFSEISNQLADTSVGIICLTKENKNKPWILFESGALAKGISSNRVCTFLIDLRPTDVENPLAQFNHSQPDKTGLWDLVRTINSTLEDKKLSEKILEKVFETYWPQFEKSFNDVIENTVEGKVVESRSENDLLVEVLSSIRSMDKRMRSVENKSDHNITFTTRPNSIRNFERTKMIHDRIKTLLDNGSLMNTIVYDLVSTLDLSHSAARIHIDKYMEINGEQEEKV